MINKSNRIKKAVGERENVRKAVSRKYRLKKVVSRKVVSRKNRLRENTLRNVELIKNEIVEIVHDSNAQINRIIKNRNRYTVSITVTNTEQIESIKNSLHHHKYKTEVKEMVGLKTESRPNSHFDNNSARIYCQGESRGKTLYKVALIVTPPQSPKPLPPLPNPDPRPTANPTTTSSITTSLSSTTKTSIKRRKKTLSGRKRP